MSGRRSDPNAVVGDLLSSSDLADLLGVNKSVISNWKKRHADTFPEPIARVARGTVDIYSAADIRAWLRGKHAAMLAFLEEES